MMGTLTVSSTISVMRVGHGSPRSWEEWRDVDGPEKDPCHGVL